MMNFSVRGFTMFEYRKRDWLWYLRELAFRTVYYYRPVLLLRSRWHKLAHKLNIVKGEFAPSGERGFKCCYKCGKRVRGAITWDAVTLGGKPLSEWNIVAVAPVYEAK